MFCVFLGFENFFFLAVFDKSRLGNEPFRGTCFFRHFWKKYLIVLSYCDMYLDVILAVKDDCTISYALALCLVWSPRRRHRLFFCCLHRSIGLLVQRIFSRHQRLWSGFFARKIMLLFLCKDFSWNFRFYLIHQFVILVTSDSKDDFVIVWHHASPAAVTAVDL